MVRSNNKKSNTKDIFWKLAWTDFKIRYHGSVFGYIWALLKPLMIFCVLYVVFNLLLGSQVEYYILHLFTGIMLWNFFSESSMLGMNSLLSKSYLLTKLTLPKWTVPLAAVCTSALGLFLNLIILAVFFWTQGLIPSWLHVGLFLIYLVCFVLFSIGVSLATSVILPRFRDLNQIWEVLLNVFMYATPIIYPLSMIPVEHQWVFYLQPFTYFIEFSKNVLILGIIPDLSLHLGMLGFVIGTVLIGSLVFVRFQRNITEHL